MARRNLYNTPLRRIRKRISGGVRDQLSKERESIFGSPERRKKEMKRREEEREVREKEIKKLRNKRIRESLRRDRFEGIKKKLKF